MLDQDQNVFDAIGAQTPGADAPASSTAVVDDDTSVIPPLPPDAYAPREPAPTAVAESRPLKRKCARRTSSQPKPTKSKAQRAAKSAREPKPKRETQEPGRLRGAFSSTRLPRPTSGVKRLLVACALGAAVFLVVAIVSFATAPRASRRAAPDPAPTVPASTSTPSVVSIPEPDPAAIVAARQRAAARAASHNPTRSSKRTTASAREAAGANKRSKTTQAAAGSQSHTRRSHKRRDARRHHARHASARHQSSRPVIGAAAAPPATASVPRAPAPASPAPTPSTPRYQAPAAAVAAPRSQPAPSASAEFGFEH